MRDRVRVPVRTWIGILLTLAIVVPLGVMWSNSRLSPTYTVMDMGEMDYGGGPRPASHQHDQIKAASGGMSVADLDTPKGGNPDVEVDLVARQEEVELADGRRVDGYTLNGTTPGPLIEATVGDLVQVRVRNQDVADGIALHWHGVDVPNAQDGVTGVTQDAIGPDAEHTYRWVAPHAGTFWYHSHQVSHRQVAGGLFGGIVIRPREAPEVAGDVTEVLALVHSYAGRITLNGREGFSPEAAAPGQPVRVRVVNTDNGALGVWSSASYRVLAVDGYDVNEPTDVSDTSLVVPAGGKVDLEMTAPEDGSAIRLTTGGAGLLLGPDGADAPPKTVQPKRRLDLLDYGSPADLPFDVRDPDRRFDYSIGRRPGFLNGKPGLWWSVNGKTLPDMPMFVVREGDVVRVRISNSSGEPHPMHLHGHHAVVLARDGKQVTGSPWWWDSLEVRDGETYDIAFLADNPGIWMDHCHDLKHAADGLVTHLMYEGVTTPYKLGEDSGNIPE